MGWICVCGLDQLRVDGRCTDWSRCLVDADKTHLDWSSSEVGELFDVLALLADQGADCLSWNKEVDNLLLLSLLLRKKNKIEKRNKFFNVISGGRENKLKLHKIVASIYLSAFPSLPFLLSMLTCILKVSKVFFSKPQDVSGLKCGPLKNNCGVLVTAWCYPDSQGHGLLSIVTVNCKLYFQRETLLSTNGLKGWSV